MANITKKILTKAFLLSIVICFSAGLCPAEETPPQAFEERHKDKSLIYLLYDITMELKEDWSYTTREHKRVEILKEEARSIGEIPLYYEKDRERITKVKAYTTSPDGKKHRYTKLQDFKKYKNFPMYSDYMVKVITLPEVIVGSILEYEATTISKGLSIKNSFWQELHFTMSHPTKELNITVILPKKLNIQYKEFNLEYKPTVTEKGSKIVYHWHIEEIDEPDKIEDYSPPPNLDNIENIIQYSSIKSWGDISDWFYALMQKNLKIAPLIEKTAKEIVSSHKSTRDKTRAILEYIQDNFRYVSMSFGPHTLEPHPTDQVFQNKYGDCKDLSLLCMAMLKVAGIKSYMALFNEEFSITDPQYDLPHPSVFDHVILLVEDKKEGSFYIDPLLDGYNIGEYPLYYQNAYIFIINEDGGIFDRLPIFDESRKYTKAIRNVTIEEDGTALIDSYVLWELGSSIDTRESFKALTDKQKKEFFQMLENTLASGGEVFEHKFEGLEEKYGPISASTKLKRKEYTVTDDMIIIDWGGAERGTDFTEDERKELIFCPLNSLGEYITTYRIPQGFRISHVPRNLNLDIGFYNIERRYKKKDDTITVTQTTRFRRKELPKEEYQKVKDFYDKLPQETDQRIVLKKSKPWREKIRDFIGRFRKEKASATSNFKN